MLNHGVTTKWVMALFLKKALVQRVIDGNWVCLDTSKKQSAPDTWEVARYKADGEQCLSLIAEGFLRPHGDVD